MLNIVVPMAGFGSRFVSAGYSMPKPLIEINGKTMIEIVVKNITPDCEHRFIFICLKEHNEKYNIKQFLLELVPDAKVILIDTVTEGAACTVLLAKKFINSSNPLMIANSDQYVEININDYVNYAFKNDGCIMTMKAVSPKWSYIKYDNEYVTLVREKEVISDEATVGIYNFSSGEKFVYYAEQMISKNIRVNNEFYVAPVYNEMIDDGMHISFYNIGSDTTKMHGLGTPEDLDIFIKWQNEEETL